MKCRVPGCGLEAHPGPCGVARRRHEYASKVTDERHAVVTEPVTHGKKVTRPRNAATIDDVAPGYVLPPVLEAIARSESERLGLSIEDWTGKVFRQPIKSEPIPHAERQAAYRARKCLLPMS